MERKDFNERIQKEYDEFKTKIIELSKEEIFEKSFEIDFKCYITNYLQNEGIVEDETIDNLSSIEGSILDELYELYLDSDGSYTYDEMCEELLEEFNGDFFEDEDDEDGELE